MAASTSAASCSFLGALTGGKTEKVKRELDDEDGEGVEAVSEGTWRKKTAKGGRYLINVSLITLIRLVFNDRF